MWNKASAKVSWHLIIPGLFGPQSQQDAVEALRLLLSDMELPALNKILGSAKIVAHNDFAMPSNGENTSLRSLVFESYDGPHMMSPSASYELNLGQPAKRFCVYADPVALKADISALFLISGSDLNITEDESKMLISSLNEYVAPWNVSFHRANRRWYMLSDEAFELHTPSPEQLHGLALNKTIFSKNLPVLWQSRINELFMLLAQHPVNINRERNGLAPISGPWLWPGPDCFQFENRCDISQFRIWSNSSIPDFMPTQSDCFTDLSGATEVIRHPEYKHQYHLILLDSLQVALGEHNVSRWQEAMLRLEQRWFEPIITAMRSNDIDEILIKTDHHYELCCQSNRIKQFWRPKRNLADMLKKIS